MIDTYTSVYVRTEAVNSSVKAVFAARSCYIREIGGVGASR